MIARRGGKAPEIDRASAVMDHLDQFGLFIRTHAVGMHRAISDVDPAAIQYLTQFFTTLEQRLTPYSKEAFLEILGQPETENIAGAILAHSTQAPKTPPFDRMPAETADAIYYLLDDLLRLSVCWAADARASCLSLDHVKETIGMDSELAYLYDKVCKT